MERREGDDPTADATTDLTALPTLAKQVDTSNTVVSSQRS